MKKWTEIMVWRNCHADFDFADHRVPDPVGEVWSGKSRPSQRTLDDGHNALLPAGNPAVTI
jgi:hypothetical protein